MSAFDTVEKLGGSTVQHGKANSRVYLMRMDRADLPGLPDTLIRFAAERGYGKVFAKFPGSALSFFRSAGYEAEAEIVGYFPGRESAVFACFYVDPDRRAGDDHEAFRIRELALSQAQNASRLDVEPASGARRLREADAEAAAGLYRRVFESYPFPIHDPAYVRHTMATHVAYYGVYESGRWIALASSEKDTEAKAAELTDFATDPDARGRGLAGGLLARMERDLCTEGFRTGFTIARALSAGMNIVFARAGYTFGGMLRNNTQICGRLEHMNVWYKPLLPYGGSP